jgi:PAS domain S-box-containing protein
MPNPAGRRQPDDPARPRLAEAVDVSGRDATWDVLSEKINDLIVITDLNGAIFYASPAARTLGYEPYELIGLTGADLIHPDELPRFLANRGHVHAGDGAHLRDDREHRFRKRDGSWVWLEGNPSLLPGPDGQPAGVLNIFRDVSERRASREALSEQTRHAAMMEEVAGVGYWRLDARTLEVSWSAQIFRMHGLPVGDTVALKHAMDMVHPDDKAESDARLAQALRDGQSWKDTLTRIVQPDCSVRYLSGSGVCETGPAGEVIAVFGTVLDVTEQETLKWQLREALAEAERAAAVKAEFLANMSHEIRTPLTAVLGFASLLSERQDLDPTAQGQIGRIAGASRALLAVVNDVLDFSKLEAGEVTIRRRPACAEQAAREVLEMFALQASAKGVDLRFEAAADLPASLILDEDRLRQILINLVGNAVKFTERGQVSLALSYDPTERLVVEVRDTGPGIAPEAKAKLFQRFSQIDGSSTRSKGGSGLGLAICQGLSEAMGGTVSVSSRLGRGSTFRLVLPALITHAGEAASLHGGGLDQLCGLRVLVADDNAANRELTRAVLEPAGLEVSEACDGLEAVEIASTLPFDVILMDLRMPGLDGRSAAAVIRRDPGPNQHMPILAFSADGMMSAEQAHAIGFQGMLHKPVAPREMLQALLNAVQDNHTLEEGSQYAAAS